MYVHTKRLKHQIGTNPEINPTLLPYLAQRMPMLAINPTDTVLYDGSISLVKYLCLNFKNSQSEGPSLIHDLFHKKKASLKGSQAVLINRPLQNLIDERRVDVRHIHTGLTDLHKLLAH